MEKAGLHILACIYITALFVANSATAVGQSKSHAIVSHRDQLVMKRMHLPSSALQQIEKNAPGAVTGETGCGRSASDYSAWQTDLGNREILAVIAQGRTPCLCSGGNCSFWIFQKTSTGFEVLLDDFGVQDFHFKSSSTMGYPDLVISTHNVPFNFKLGVFRFDGTGYGLQECWDRSFATWDKHGEVVQVSKQARITRVECPQL